MSVARKQIDQPARTVRLAYVVTDQTNLSGACTADVPRDGDEFWMIAEWSRTGESLAFHAESLISWAPVEILELPTELVDEAGQSKWLCKFRYFGPVKDRARLIDNVIEVLGSLAQWQSVRVHSL